MTSLLYVHRVEAAIIALSGLSSLYELVFLSLKLINGWEEGWPYKHSGLTSLVALHLRWP